METIIYAISLSTIMLLFLNWVYFFDWYKLIGGILALMAPKRKIKEIEDEKLLRKSEVFKKHLHKWKLRFLCTPVVFSSVFIILYVLTKHALISYLSGLVVITAIYHMLAKREAEERKNIEKAK